MSSYFAELTQRREALVARSDRDRDELAATFGRIRSRVIVAEKLVDGIRRAREHRGLIGIVSALAIVAPFAARKWVRRMAWFLPLVIEGVKLARSHRS